MRRLLLGLALLAVPAAAGAQDFGVMEPARTIAPGALVFRANPTIAFGEGDTGNQFGISVLAGYGFTASVDAEFGAAIYEDVSFVGGSVKLWVVRDTAVDIAASAGLHVGRSDAADTTGFDVTLIGSTLVAPRLTFFGALDLAVDSVNDADASFKTLHLVPGLEYELRSGVDVVLEVGVALSDDAVHYVSAGLTLYLR